MRSLLKCLGIAYQALTEFFAAKEPDLTIVADAYYQALWSQIGPIGRKYEKQKKSKRENARQMRVLLKSPLGCLLFPFLLIFPVMPLVGILFGIALSNMVTSQTWEVVFGIGQILIFASVIFLITCAARQKSPWNPLKRFLGWWLEE